MELNWRWGAAAGAGAFVISLFFGLFAGVFFGTLLLRALVGGIIFGAIGIACNLLISRFLPELMDSPGNVPAAEGAGENVDITIQDEPGSAGPAEKETDQDEQDLLRPTMDVDSLVEEVEESTVADARGIDVISKEAAPPSAGQANGRAEPAADFHDVDELPDIDGFSGSFVSERFPETDDAKTEHRPVSGGSNAGAAGDKNPETLARVVQTLIRKDQKG